ncbi:hypothetical protein CE91St62_39630 [Lachnospiraceae bacterium]|uniref:hypothetical protein n=1 Tax=Extibacter sp. GGCC_0201 TaxID=2731209 RepID=UPI001AA12A71|nr:hypothetical protein [Extibacter sp. GGCC_0201]MBO1720676.1 hypothetical protein [Extibacter sp. GGCC_0201]BDF35902.1 hypothetical protein CE91St61_39770 [Lachnospiraceae bacterium]BDF39902.1 hypothetical protein CE91St62_39630 [Lachnospiraceae bacterium]
MMDYESARKYIAEDTGCRDAVLKLRLQALQQFYQRADGYLKKGFLPELVEAFFDKKVEMLKEVSTKSDMKELLEVSKPVYNGNRITPSDNRFYVEEEELMLWSLTSLQAPLKDIGYQRYRELFQKYLPAQAQQIW